MAQLCDGSGPISTGRFISRPGRTRCGTVSVGETVAVSEEDFHDLCVVHLCDWLEQVERSGAWDYRRTGYRDLALRLGGRALERYERTFAEAPEQTWFGEYAWPTGANR